MSKLIHTLEHTACLQTCINVRMTRASLYNLACAQEALCLHIVLYEKRYGVVYNQVQRYNFALKWHPIHFLQQREQTCNTSQLAVIRHSPFETFEVVPQIWAYQTIKLLVRAQEVFHTGHNTFRLLLISTTDVAGESNDFFLQQPYSNFLSR